MGGGLDPKMSFTRFKKKLFSVLSFEIQEVPVEKPFLYVKAVRFLIGRKAAFLTKRNHQDLSGGFSLKIPNPLHIA